MPRVPRVITLARHVLAVDDPLKILLRQLPAALFPALAGLARLLHLGRVDAVKAYLGFADPDGVAINNAGGAGYICISRYGKEGCD